MPNQEKSPAMDKITLKDMDDAVNELLGEMLPSRLLGIAPGTVLGPCSKCGDYMKPCRCHLLADVDRYVKLIRATMQELKTMHDEGAIRSKAFIRLWNFIVGQFEL